MILIELFVLGKNFLELWLFLKSGLFLNSIWKTAKLFKEDKIDSTSN